MAIVATVGEEICHRQLSGRRRRNTEKRLELLDLALESARGDPPDPVAGSQGLRE